MNVKLLCYVCGEFTQKSQTNSIIPRVKKSYEFNFGLKFVIRTPAGHHIHVAVDVCDVHVAGSLALTVQCLSQSLWCGENRIVLQTAAFV
jgi:hypothetical protein